MTIWGWIVVAGAAFVGLSIALGLVIARVLGSISAGFKLMFEEESWRSAPLTRAVKAARMDERKRRSVRRAAQGWKTRR